MDLSSPTHLAAFDAVLVVSQQAGLALEPERLRAVAPIILEWWAAANALSRRMSAPEHQTLVPIVALRHAPAGGGAA